MERRSDSGNGITLLLLQAVLGMPLCHTEVSACAVCHHRSLLHGSFHVQTVWASHPNGKFLSLIGASR